VNANVSNYSDLELRAGLAMIDSAIHYAHETHMTLFTLGVLLDAGIKIARELVHRGAPVSCRMRSTGMRRYWPLASVVASAAAAGAGAMRI
jgi:hypothetical protein